MDNFDKTFMLFKQRRDHADIAKEDTHRVFFITGRARQFGFDPSKTKNLNVENLVERTQSRVFTSERTKDLFHKWKSAS